jgi:hypothetical protein
MTPTNTPLPDLSGLKKADIDLLLDLGARLGRGEVIGGTPYAVKCWQAIGRFEALIAKVEGLEGKEEGSAGSDLSPASRSHTPLSAGWQIVGREPKDAYALVYSAAYKWRGLGGLAIAYRHDSYNGHCDVWTLDGRAGRPVSGKNAPTHWMPLPPPPAESSPSGAQRSELAISAPDDPKSNSGADQ